jgi:hypothetical protein
LSHAFFELPQRGFKIATGDPHYATAQTVILRHRFFLPQRGA